MRRFLPRSWSTRALVLLVVASCVVACAWSAQSLRSSAQQADEREEALNAARQAAESFTTYDYRKLDRSFDALLAGGTEEFRSTFGQAVDQLRPIIKREKALSTGTVVASAISDVAKDDAATVLVAMNVTVTNRSSQEGRERRFRLRVQLENVDGEWRLDEIATVT